MLKKIRLTLATFFFVGLTLLFLDLTGALHAYLGWMAKMQFWPAMLAVNVPVLAIIILMTLLFGRIYCSVICPLGVMQDVIARIGRTGRRNPYSFSKEKKWVRYPMLAIAIGLIPLGLFSLLAPYSAFGRIATTLLRPVWIWGNNILAGMAERADTYMFYRVDVLAVTGATLAVAIATLLVVGILAARNGRTYCNTICPVGTILGLLSRFSMMKIVIDENRCRNCGKCAKNCKAACIDAKNHTVDYSRCVVCGDCLENCEFDAIAFGKKKMIEKENKIAAEVLAKETAQPETGAAPDLSRRGALVSIALATTAAAMAQDSKKVDGGLAVIEDKIAPERKTRILPPGAGSHKHLHHTCTACQLCVSACPNKVLRPSSQLNNFMQPYVSYEQGYCRPECHECGAVCPAGAIANLGVETKASTKVGTAIVIKKNCLAANGKAECGNCERHCPAEAIHMVKLNEQDDNSPRIPAVDETRCIGCGACEYVCPARPFSAIYVEGIEVQREIKKNNLDFLDNFENPRKSR